MKCECEACPFNYHSEMSMYANDMGCLPDSKETLTIFQETGAIWACHDNPKVPCQGLINHYDKKGTKLEKEKLKISLERNILKHEYGVHGREYDFVGYVDSYLKIGTYTYPSVCLSISPVVEVVTNFI